MKTPQARPKDIDRYISGCPEGVRDVLIQLRDTISKAAPAATQTIKYGMPTFVLGENLVHFAACKRHIGFYPTPSAIVAFRESLSSYKCSKGAVQFPLDAPMPMKLIERIVRFRVEEARSRNPLSR